MYNQGTPPPEVMASFYGPKPQKIRGADLPDIVRMLNRSAMHYAQ